MAQTHCSATDASVVLRLRAADAGASLPAAADEIFQQVV
jgi:hypothetical protein